MAVTDNVDKVPGIHIQHIEALPYQVAVVTTDCGGGQVLRSRRSCDLDVAEPDNKHRYIIIHNELSSTSSLSHSRGSRSSKASSINMSNFSSIESDTVPVTMTTTSAANRQRHSSQQESKTSMCAAAAAAVNLRRLSCEVHRCNDDDDDDNDTMTNDSKLRHTSSLSSPAVHGYRRHRDNSIVLVELVCDCHSPSQQTIKTSRLRPRSASESPTNRSRVSIAGATTGPKSDSEITVRPTHSHQHCDNGATILQV